MTHSRSNWFRMLLRFAGVIVFALPAGLWAQDQAPPAPVRGVAPLLTRCATVSMKSTSGWLSLGILADKLRERAEFQNAGLKLLEPGEMADVQLTITDEVDEGRDFRNTRVPSSPEAILRALRTADGRTAERSVVGMGAYEGIVTGTIIEVLHELCPAVMMPERIRGSVLEALDPAVVEQLRQGHTLVVDSFTYLDDEKFSRRLAARPEVRAWNLQVSAEHRAADLRLEIRRLSNSKTWQCQLFDRSHRLLWMHSAGALTEEHAVAGIIDGLIDQVARYRDTPVRAPDRNTHHARKVRQGQWHAQLITGDFRTTLQPLDIAIDGEHFIVRDTLGKEVFRIGAAELEDVDRSTVRDPIWQPPPPTSGIYDWTNDPEIIAELDPRLAGALLAAESGAVSAYSILSGAWAAILFPFNPKQHFIEIAWKDGDVERTAMFQLSGRDAGRLLDATWSLIESEKLRPPEAGKR
jgi:hypothetical protein